MAGDEFQDKVIHRVVAPACAELEQVIYTMRIFQTSVALINWSQEIYRISFLLKDIPITLIHKVFCILNMKYHFQ